MVICVERERRPTDDELAVLDIWLRHKTDVAQSLRDQLGQPFTVSRSCGCGCGSIAFHLGAEAVSHRLATDGTYEVEGFVETDHALGGLLLFIRNGVIAEIDAHSFGDSHLQFPEPETVRWGARRGENAVVPFATELVVKVAVVAEFVDTIRSRFTPLGDTECRFAGITTSTTLRPAISDRSAATRTSSTQKGGEFRVPSTTPKLWRNLLSSQRVSG